LSILDYFPGEPRDVQRTCLLEVEKGWDSHDVIVVVAPTATGKTHLAKTIADWSGHASIVVPNNVLLDQYVDMFPDVCHLKKRGSYQCLTHHRSCEETHRILKRCCSRVPCAYRQAVIRAKRERVVLANYWTYMVHRLYRNTLIVDEAHLLLPTLQDVATKRIWHKDYGWPLGVKTLGDLVSWVEKVETTDKKLKKLKKELLATEETTLIQKGTELCRGVERNLLKLIPLDTKNEPPIFWPPKKVRKVVLMSATISRVDVESMGLAGKRVLYVECDSPIPVENRPIIFEPVANMSFKHQDESIPVMVEYIRYLLENNPDRGLIHAPYALAAKLKAHLEDEPRLMWHDKENKQEQLGEFLDADDDQVLVSSGMYEGLDLCYDAGRWQLIVKVPYPSLADPAIRAKLNKDPSWYAWSSIRTILQASGRISRASDDYGRTFLGDSAFSRLFQQNKDLFPNWWAEALVEI
jgi:Rad3-related DNA helicase